VTGIADTGLDGDQRSKGRDLSHAALAGVPSLIRLTELGVARVSLGGGLQRLTMTALAEQLAALKAEMP
jgi:hypothetical protein